MDKKTPQLLRLKEQKAEMVSLLTEWVEINSHSLNLEGLALMATKLKEALAPLGGKIEELPLPPRTVVDSSGAAATQNSGVALRAIKRPDAPFKLFLGGHMDTVYPASSPFQKARLQDNGAKLHGPGAADMKGGLLIMIKALEAFEQHPMAERLGWELLINPDEEIGSTASEPLLLEAARRNRVGLLFEPAFHDGALVSQRKGSANFSVVARGKAAHAGRDFFEGRNAITALARFMVKAESLIDAKKGVTLNVGRAEGGETSNIVPAIAICRCNLRVNDSEEFPKAIKKLETLVAEENCREGLSLTLHLETERPPKPFDAAHQKLYEGLNSCASELGFHLSWRESGGVCDGNILSAAGLPTIDTLGAVGGYIHTPEEYALTESLVTRSQLTALYMIKLATGELLI